jgi:hypothetical protein
LPGKWISSSSAVGSRTRFCSLPAGGLENRSPSPTSSTKRKRSATSSRTKGAPCRYQRMWFVPRNSRPPRRRKQSP